MKLPIGCLLMALGAGCQFPELPALPTVPVGGDVVGLWTGGDLRLALRVSAVTSDEIVVAREGTFAFAAGASAGERVSVEIVAQPARHTCAVENGTDRLVEAAITDLVVRCTSDIPVDIVLDGPMSLAFDPQRTANALVVSVLQTELAVVVTAPGEATIEVDGVPTPASTRSAPVALPFGASDVPVKIVVGSLSREYVLSVNRGTPAPDEYRYLKAWNAEAADTYAEAIAADRDYIVVGAIGEDSAFSQESDDYALAGAIYVYRRTNDGWTEDAYLKGTQPGINRILGFSVAIDGDTIVGGAHGAGAIPGVAYVFRRGATWLEQQRLTNPLVAASDGFGFNVAADGATIAVSDITTSAVYVFTTDGTAWTHVSTVTTPDSVATDRFGHRVLLDGDLMVVAAPAEDSSATGVSVAPAPGADAPDSGAVYVFRRAGSQWGLEAFIKPSTAVANTNFAEDIALHDGLLVVGAQSREDAHVFRRTDAGWSQSAVLRPTGASLGWGTAVAVRGDLVAVGERSALRVQLFRESASTWLAAGEVTGSNSEQGDNFGTDVALAGNGLVVGAPQEASSGAAGDNSAPDAGAAYVFR